MIISLIAAMAANRVIGNAGIIPWKLPADMKRFRMLTMGKPIIMGRKTFESIGSALSGRLNIVMTRDKTFYAKGCRVVTSREDALIAAGDVAEIMIIGGEGIYKEFLPLANRIYLTVIDAHIEGDAFFPAIDDVQWHEMSYEEYEPDDKNKYRYTFMTFERI